MKKLTCKLLAFLLVATMMMAMTGCGGTKPGTDDSSKQPDNTVEEQVKDGKTIYPCTVMSEEGSQVTLEK